MRKILLLFAIFLVGWKSFAQNSNLLNEDRPRLVIGITIENMRADYLTKFESTFQQGGFKRLLKHGAVFQNARLDIHNIRTSTGLATISTGVYPASHGIVSDEWLNQLTEEMIHCVRNDKYLTLGSDSDEGNCSADRLQSFTLGDQLKSYFPQSKVFSVALNAEAAILAGGHNLDAAFWLDNVSGNMISSSYYIEKFPGWLEQFNNNRTVDVYNSKEWELLMPERSYTASLNDKNDYEQGFWKRFKTMPYKLENMRTIAENSYEVMKATPFGNRFLTDFTKQLIESEMLGNDEIPDLLNITFSTLDFANKWFEPQSIEIQDLYLRLDQDIANILNYLDNILGKDNYLVYLTSPSTSENSVRMLANEYNFSAGEFYPESTMALLRSYLNILYGVNNWIIGYSEEQIYLNHQLIEKEDIKLEDIQKSTALFLNQFKGVKAAIPSVNIELGNVSDKNYASITNSYYPKRSGDLLIVLEAGWQPAYKFGDSNYTSINKVPLLFYGKGIKPGNHFENVTVTQIVPTIAKVLKILPPDDVVALPVDNLFW